MKPRAAGTGPVKSTASVLLAVAALLITSCTATDEVVFEGAAPEQAGTSVTTAPATKAPVVTSPPDGTTTPETTTVITRAAATSEPTRSTLAISEQQIDQLMGQVVINSLLTETIDVPLTESVAILGPGTDRLELFAAAGEFISQPTWSPDGRFVAWSRYAGERSSVVVSSASTGEGIEYATPFVVFYMQWRPDGRALGLLGAPEPDRVALAILDLDRETVTSLNTSSSYYFHWSPEGDEMITHLGRAGLELLDPMTGDASPLATLNTVNSEFQAAAWTSEGRSVLYVRPGNPDQAEPQDELVLHDLDTGQIDVLGEGVGVFNFAVSPDGNSVAYSSRDRSFVTSMHVVDLATGRVDEIDAPDTFVWQWSPDSHKILLLGVSANDMTVSVYESGNITRYQSMTPTFTFFYRYLVFWNQYDLSHTLWAPDSSGFVYAAFDRNSDLVFLQLLDEELPILLGPGSMAAFSPATGR